MSSSVSSLDRTIVFSSASLEDFCFLNDSEVCSFFSCAKIVIMGDFSSKFP